VAVETLGKEAGVWCKHSKPGKGCLIHGSHPDQCSGFQCLYLEDQTLGEEWKPSRCKFVVRGDDKPGTIIIDVDPGYPTAWKAEPFYSQIKSWSHIARGGRGRVLIYLGRMAISVFPEEDIPIGNCDPGDILESGYRQGVNWLQPFIRITRGEITSERLGSVYRS
jgi:hypothetical protein